MKNLALKLYNNGYSCTSSIIMSAEKKYNIDISKQFEDGIGIINNGFGIQGMCGVLISAIIVIGAVLGTEKGRIGRIIFFDKFFNRYKYIDCQRLSSETNDCNEIIKYVCNITDEVINELI